MSAPQIDELDRALLAMLSRDARLSNRKIAAELNVTEGTVRSRIKRMQQERLISFTALTSIDLNSANKLAFLGVQADFQKLQEVARAISGIEEVTSVLITLGRFNILAVCFFRDLDELHATASDRILAMPGVRHIETSIAVKTIKYNSRIVRITDADADTDPGNGDNGNAAAALRK